MLHILNTKKKRFFAEKLRISIHHLLTLNHKFYSRHNTLICFYIVHITITFLIRDDNKILKYVLS